MKLRNQHLYCPALRTKAGELAGVSELAQDVAACTLPRFIIPPRSERDPRQFKLFISDGVPDISAMLGRHWRGRTALIDVAYVIKECGHEHLTWLPKVFERARKSGVVAVPVAWLRDLEKSGTEAFRASYATDAKLKMAIRLSSGEMVGREYRDLVTDALTRMGLAPEECAVIADFHDADFSAPDVVAPIITDALESLQELGTWQHIVFQGTNYPEVNPAKHGGSKLWPRNEWHAWCLAVKFDESTAEHMMFGDYAADSAKMNFTRSRAAAIRHYRYATPTDWLIERGEQSGADRHIMQRVCKNIVESGYFAGEGFSTADAYILRTANNDDGPGNASIWRQVNTTHHITRVVADLAKVRGIPIAEKIPTGNGGGQLSLLRP